MTQQWVVVASQVVQGAVVAAALLALVAAALAAGLGVVLQGEDAAHVRDRLDVVLVSVGRLEEAALKKRVCRESHLCSLNY